MSLSLTITAHSTQKSIRTQIPWSPKVCWYLWVLLKEHGLIGQ